MFRNLLNDENGFIVSSEMVLIFTLIFCGVVVGVGSVRRAINHELNDISESVGALDQSYNFRSVTAANEAGVSQSRQIGSGFNDEEDDCDGRALVLGSICGKDDPSTLNNNEDGTP
jgi:hypothetical protein